MGMLIPIHSLLVPIYVVFKKCGISDQWYTLLLPYVSFGLPMGIFLVEGYVKTIPVSLEEAAAIDEAAFQIHFGGSSADHQTDSGDSCDHTDL